MMHNGYFGYMGMHYGWWLFIIVVVIVLVGLFLGLGQEDDHLEESKRSVST